MTELISSAKVRRLVSVILLISLLTSVLSGCSGSLFAFAGASGPLVINEVVTSNSLSLVDSKAGSPDWIELYNRGDKDIDLNGYNLINDKNKPRLFTFPACTIKAGGYLMLYCMENASNEATGGALQTGFVLPKEGVTLQLTDKSGSVVQTLNIPALEKDISYGLDKNGVYKFFSSPTPNAPNGEDGTDSMQTLASLPTPTVRINEVCPNSVNSLLDEEKLPSDWVELYNTGDKTVSLKNFWLSDNTANATKWKFPDVQIAAGQYLTVFLSGKDRTDAGKPLHASFKLADDETSIVLSDPQGKTIDKLEWSQNILPDMSFGRIKDGTVKYFSVPTPNKQNADTGVDSVEMKPMTKDDPVRLSEVLVKNTFSIIDQDGDREAFAELYNSSSKPVSLKTYHLSDDSKDISKWNFPDVTLDAGKYIIVFLSGKDRAEAGKELHASFRLGSADTTLILTDTATMRSDKLDIPADRKDNVSMGRAQGGDSWLYYFTPTPGGPNNTKSADKLASVMGINPDSLWISEVKSVSPPKSGKTDSIEIANGSSHAVDLKGYYLSDDTDNPKKWQIPGGTVPAKGYTVINASSKVSRQTAGVAKFGIRLSGERLMLTSPEGYTLDVFDTGTLRADISSGRASGDYSGKRVFFTTPTLGTANSGGTAAAYTAQPVFSIPGGYIDSAKSVEITSPTQGASIYYTTDGSQPTTSSSRYSGPVPINSTTTLKAVAVANGMLPSEYTVATYLKETKHTIPVVCISGNPGDISTVRAVVDRNVKIEKKVDIEYYEADGTLGVSFPAGIRAAGAGTRVYAQKSLNIYLRGGYGRSSVTYPFFKDFGITTFESLSLRNNGQDRQSAMIRDAFCGMAVKGMDVDYAEYRPVAVYLNGEYFGLYELKENQNEDYFASRYNIQPDNVEVIRRNQTPLAGTSAEIKKVRQYAISHNMADEASFKWLSDRVDTKAFMDYIIAETYFSNSDMFNQKFWRAIDYSAKWRPIFYDLDWGAKNNPGHSILGSMFNPAGVPSVDGSLTNMDLQCALLQNPGWKKAFIERYAQVINNDFSSERLLKLFDDMVAEMRPEMERQIKRWGAPSSMTAWEANVEDVRDFIQKRPALAADDLRGFFGLSSEQMKTLFPNR